MKYKIITIFGLAFFLLISSACEKELLEKTNPNEPSTSSFYKTESDAIEAINSVYSATQFFGVYNRYWNYTQSSRSDESMFTDKQAGLPEVNGLDDFTMTSTVDAVHEHWRDNYNGIRKANMVIERVPDIQFSDDLKNRIIGEAHFLRALFHFNLILFFGEEIPMYTKNPTDLDEFFPYPAEIGQIYQFLVEDFQKAKDLLPTVDTYRGTDNIGRVSKGAATALLGKTYLFMKNYQAAADEFSQIVSGQVGTYELTTRFRDNHDNNNENNIESIFEIQYALTSGNVWNISGENAESGEQQIIEQGQSMMDAAGGMWWNQEPTDKMIAEFETSDPRYYKSFWAPGGDTYEDILGNHLTYQQYAGARTGHLGWRKWGRDYETAAVESDVNVRIMRLADVYLMYAECLIEGASGAGTPEMYINLIRDRARNIPDAPNYPLTGVLPTVEQLMAQAPVINGITINNIKDAYRHERMIELAYEGKRWDDIVRWDLGSKVLIPTYKYLLPIYQGDLDTNPNLKPNSAN